MLGYDRVVSTYISPDLAILPYFGVGTRLLPMGSVLPTRTYNGPPLGSVAAQKAAERKAAADRSFFSNWIRPASPPPQTSDPQTLAQRAQERSQARADAALPQLRLHVQGAARTLEARTSHRASSPTTTWSNAMVRTLVDIESQKDLMERSIKARARAKFRQMSSQSGQSGGGSWMPWGRGSPAAAAGSSPIATLLPAAERRGTLRTPLEVVQERERGLRELRSAFYIFNASQSGALSPQEVLRMLRAVMPDGGATMEEQDARHFIADNEDAGEAASGLSFDGFVRGMVALTSGTRSFVEGNDPDIVSAAEAAVQAVHRLQAGAQIAAAGLTDGPRALIAQGMDEQQVERQLIEMLERDAPGAADGGSAADGSAGAFDAAATKRSESSSGSGNGDEAVRELFKPGSSTDLL